MNDLGFSEIVFEFWHGGSNSHKVKKFHKLEMTNEYIIIFHDEAGLDTTVYHRKFIDEIRVK